MTARLAPWVGTLARLLLGTVMLVAGAMKLADPQAAVRAVAAYDLLPFGAAQVVGYALPGFEVVLGLLLLTGVATRASAVMSGVLLDQLVEQGRARVQYHPVAILGAASVRAAAAAGCAQDAGAFVPYHSALFTAEEATFSTAQLKDIGHSVGLTSGDFDQCVDSQRYRGWVEAATQEATRRGVSGTPTVFVEGTQLPAGQTTVAGLLAAIESASG